MLRNRVNGQKTSSEPQLVGRRNSAVNAPVWLSVEGPSLLLLPGVVEGGEENEVLHVVGKGLFYGLDGQLLLGQTWDSESVGLTLDGPATLADDNSLVLGQLGLEVVDGLGEPDTGLASGDGRVEEGVGVDSAVVTLSAELGVRTGSNKSIDSDNRAFVSGGTEDLSGLLNGAEDLLRASLALVDELVSDADGANYGPVAVDAINNLLGLLLNRVEIPDAEEHLHVVLLGARVDDGYLVTVGAVDTNERVRTSETVEVILDLLLGLALMIATVGGVRDTREAGAAVLGAGWKTGRSITASLSASGSRSGTSDGLGIGSRSGKSNGGEARVWLVS